MEFLRKKWAYWFSSLDVDHNGLISRADVDKTLKDFPIVEGLTEKKAKLADAKLEKWWTMHILKGRSKITETEFLQDVENQYKKDKKAFQETSRKMVTEIISIFYPKAVTLDSYVKTYMVFGHENEQLLQKAFELLKPTDGKLSIEEYTEDWVTFLTNDDPSKPDVVMDTYKAGI